MAKPLTPKSKRLVQTARDLFFHHGISRVTVGEICQKAGVSRMMFYNYFRNKDAIIIHIINEIYTEFEDIFDQIVAKDIPFDEKVRQVLDIEMKMTDEYSMEFITDLLSNGESEVAKFIKQKNDEWYELIKKFYADAQKRGEIRQDIKTEFIIFVIEHFREIILDTEIQKMYPDISQLMDEMFTLFFYGIVN